MNEEGILRLLEEELVPAAGCTEPIAVAYAAAIARDVLKALPRRVEIAVSGNILKNVKSVVVPNTGGRRGIAAAVIAGLVAGRPDQKLEILKDLTEEEQSAIDALLGTLPVAVEKSDSGCIFDIAVRAFGETDEAYVRIEGHHTNVVEIAKNGVSIRHGTLVGTAAGKTPPTIKESVEFADTVPLEKVAPLIDRQLEYNMAIAKEGLARPYGARIGSILLSAFGSDVHTRARAYAAAGSDARMNGCEQPVVIVSGSGNQGITASVPVAIYAEERGAPHELLVRAVLVSDLVTLRLKAGIGRLSAYCGAVSAGVGAGAGVAYLYGGKFDEVAHTVVNGLAIASGIVCDGAKASCAAKIASAVDAGLLGFEMYRSGSQFYGGDGILARGVESTIENVGCVARNGMRATDEEIIRLMIENLGS